MLETDLPKDKLTEALRAFAQLADEADWALVYYAGHGIELGGANYLVPVDAKLSADRDIGFEAVRWIRCWVRWTARSCASWCSMPAATIRSRARCAAR